MPLSQLDATPALVVIDLQKGIVGLPTAHPSAQIVDQSAALIRAFRAKGLPVVLVNVAGGAPGRTDAVHNFTPAADWAELVPELDQQPSDHTITKVRWGAFHDGTLDTYLKSRGVTQIVLCGIATSMGVESTARQAHELGYHVVLVGDAMTDLDAERHAHALAKVFPMLGEVTSTNDVVQAVGARQA